MRYAITDDGLELPVIDITHPTFACDMSDEELSAIIEESARGLEVMASMPMEQARPLIDSSILLRGMVQSSGTYLSGMMTHLYRLGPNNLGEGYASPLDGSIAASFMPLCARITMHV